MSFGEANEYLTKYQQRFLVKNRALQTLDENVGDMDVKCDSLWSSIMKVEEQVKQEAFLKLSRKRQNSIDKGIYMATSKGK